MSERKRYQELIAWQRAMEMARAVYKATKQFPDDERFGLTSQIRRAAVSVASNIAEGQGRLTAGEFRQFLGQARGSAFEVETQIQLASDLGYIPAQQAAKLIELTSEVSRLLNGLIRSISTGTQTRNPEPRN